MSGLFTPGLQVHEHIRVRRLRELPLAGELLVKVGDVVDSGTIVARASLPGELHILRVAESLGIEPEEVLKGLKVVQGDAISTGQLLCEHAGFFGLFKSRFISPVDGVIELLSPETAHIAVRSAPKLLELDAYIKGRVVEVVDGRSVLIEAETSFVQGIFGIGGEKRGQLRILDVAAGEVLTPGKLPDVRSGDILVGGTRPTVETLQKASAAGAVGMIVGAIDDQALAAYLGYDLGIAITGDEKVSMSVIVTEGFGEIPMSERVLSLLKRNDGKQAALNGATQVRAGAIRPEILVFQESGAGQASLDSAHGNSLQVGARIRLIRVPYFGMVGEVVELPKHLHRLDTGAEARVLRARLESTKEVVTVPRANVELL